MSDAVAVKEGRDARQQGLVPPERLAQVHAVVVGTGAIGRQVALQLSSMGVPSITLIDFDIVEEVNLGPQGWSPKDIGSSKVSVVAATCREQCGEAAIDAREERFEPLMVMDVYRGDRTRFPRLCVFLCVDRMDVRREIWEAMRPFASFICDGRMSAEVLRVLAIDEPGIDTYYSRTLFADAEAFSEACTARSTIYSSCVAAGLMVGALAKWLRAFPNDRDILMSLLTMEVSRDIEGEVAADTAPLLLADATVLQEAQ